MSAQINYYYYIIWTTEILPELNTNMSNVYVDFYSSTNVIHHMLYSINRYYVLPHIMVHQLLAFGALKWKCTGCMPIKNNILGTGLRSHKVSNKELIQVEYPQTNLASTEQNHSA